MSSLSAARVLDHLDTPEATFPDADVSVATVPRSERIAPDVTAIGGAEAVSIVRAGGFIAAIESVASELAEGTVVEQEPPAGERLAREGVITLRLAAPPLDSVQLAAESEAGLACEQAARTAGPDDTEEWFQALAPSRRDTLPVGRPANAIASIAVRRRQPVSGSGYGGVWMTLPAGITSSTAVGARSTAPSPSDCYVLRVNASHREPRLPAPPMATRDSLCREHRGQLPFVQSMGSGSGNRSGNNGHAAAA